jgi:hypothetical protein
MKQYYYNLFLQSGDILWFYNNKKILIGEYRNIVDNIMSEISIENDKEEPYICRNDSFNQKVFNKFKVYGFKPLLFRGVNYDTDNLIIS